MPGVSPILDQEIFRAGLVSFRPESVHFAVDLYIRYRNAPI
jgi:hypothetical protein